MKCYAVALSSQCGEDDRNLRDRSCGPPGFPGFGLNSKEEAERSQVQVG